MRLRLGVTCLAGFACFAGTGTAEEQVWQRLDGPAITTALSARVLAYGNGGIQNFHADGSTLYESGPPSLGRWKVEDNRYCSQWPPENGWTCYWVESGSRGIDIRFIGDDGTVTPGRYIDLN